MDKTQDNAPRAACTPASDGSLLPCPFCGYEELRVPGFFRVVCPNCDARGPANPEAWGLESDQADQPENLWNRRANNRSSVPPPVAGGG